MLMLLGLIPGAMSLIQFVVGKYKDAQVQITMAQLSCDRDKAVAIVNERIAGSHDRVAALGVIASSTILLWLTVAFATPIIIYEWRVVVHDVVMGLGETDKLGGQVADWANSIIWAIFGSATVMHVLERK